MITSPHNEKLKEIRRLARRRGRERSGAFVAEGEDLLAAADAAGWPARERYVAAGSGLEGVEVKSDVLAKVSALGSGTRALAVYEERWAAPVGPLCVYLHRVADPGNVGAVLRAAVAFGAGAVVLGPGCADPFGPRAVRASMGTIFSVPVARADGPGDLPGERVALVPRAGQALAGPAEHEVTLVVGAERDGLPAEVVAACDRTVHIPIAAESLNAAMAATVALYELTRNRMAAS
ncbi:MAG: methyltransferase, TrmH family [Solirubrobacteraceae bacterium]|nr:methyltransferase, TrmH family [Solirubrobacteraceae bacterium]